MKEKIFSENIKKLRELNNLTQNQLADSLHIGRGAVSKWERGVSIPDVDILLRLSEVFGVSVNTLLCENADSSINDITLKSDTKTAGKSKKILIVILSRVALLMLAFLFYYFIITYNSTKVYVISGNGINNHQVEGLYIKTNEKYYFYVGAYSGGADNYVYKTELYLKHKEKKRKLIASIENKNMFITELKGYDEFNMKAYLDKEYTVYLKIYYADTSEMIPLEFRLDYSNDYSISSSVKPIATALAKHKYEMTEEEKIIVDYMKNNYARDSHNNYSKNFNYDGDAYVAYNESDNQITILKENDSWVYNLNNKVLTHFGEEGVIEFYGGEMSCLLNDCANLTQKDDEFWEIIDVALK